MKKEKKRNDFTKSPACCKGHQRKEVGRVLVEEAPMDPGLVLGLVGHLVPWLAFCLINWNTRGTADLELVMSYKICKWYKIMKF